MLSSKDAIILALFERLPQEQQDEILEILGIKEHAGTD